MTRAERTRVAAYALSTDDAGRMMGIAAILRDVTTRFGELRALRKELAARSDRREGSP